MLGGGARGPAPDLAARPALDQPAHRHAARPRARARARRSGGARSSTGAAGTRRSSIAATGGGSRATAPLIAAASGLAAIAGGPLAAFASRRRDAVRLRGHVPDARIAPLAIARFALLVGGSAALHLAAVAAAPMRRAAPPRRIGADRARQLRARARRAAVSRVRAERIALRDHAPRLTVSQKGTIAMKLHVPSFLIGVTVGAGGAAIAPRLRPVALEIATTSLQARRRGVVRVARGREDLVGSARRGQGARARARRPGARPRRPHACGGVTCGTSRSSTRSPGRTRLRCPALRAEPRTPTASPMRSPPSPGVREVKRAPVHREHPRRPRRDRHERGARRCRAARARVRARGRARRAAAGRP